MNTTNNGSAGPSFADKMKKSTAKARVMGGLVKQGSARKLGIASQFVKQQTGKAVSAEDPEFVGLLDDLKTMEASFTFLVKATRTTVLINPNQELPAKKFLKEVKDARAFKKKTYQPARLHYDSLLAHDISSLKDPRKQEEAKKNLEAAKEKVNNIKIQLKKMIDNLNSQKIEKHDATIGKVCEIMKELRPKWEYKEGDNSPYSNASTSSPLQVTSGRSFSNFRQGFQSRNSPTSQENNNLTQAPSGPEMVLGSDGIWKEKGAPNKKLESLGTASHFAPGENVASLHAKSGNMHDQSQSQNETHKSPGGPPGPPGPPDSSKNPGGPPTAPGSLRKTPGGPPAPPGSLRKSPAGPPGPPRSGSPSAPRRPGSPSAPRRPGSPKTPRRPGTPTKKTSPPRPPNSSGRKVPPRPPTRGM